MSIEGRSAARPAPLFKTGDDACQGSQEREGSEQARFADPDRPARRADIFAPLDGNLGRGPSMKRRRADEQRQETEFRRKTLLITSKLLP